MRTLHKYSQLKICTLKGSDVDTLYMCGRKKCHHSSYQSKTMRSTGLYTAHRVSHAIDPDAADIDQLDRRWGNQSR
jgi:hypothetical protein